MVSMKNPLAAIVDSNRFTGLNYQDWLRYLNLVLASEKLLYAIEKSSPKEAPADISPEELTKYAADILFHLKELYGENSQHERFTAVKELMTSRMRDGTSVREHGVRMIGLVEKLSGLVMVPEIGSLSK
ncbi:hypothetical protein F511_38649 [Dorcoceras hygrometricum]|uniref:Uncharacterized protein n=1 Tax=Dorcoceras hygrometricum TaxID=472368 RepID=A0A2Z7CZZ8_9LAMI|nr:hypothetical protein F511_38649 [Dorcoceras hygrometricum]